jgi:hypothetical protein
MQAYGSSSWLLLVLEAFDSVMHNAPKGWPFGSQETGCFFGLSQPYSGMQTAPMHSACNKPPQFVCARANNSKAGCSSTAQQWGQLAATVASAT